MISAERLSGVSELSELNGTAHYLSKTEQRSLCDELLAARQQLAEMRRHNERLAADLNDARQQLGEEHDLLICAAPYLREFWTGRADDLRALLSRMRAVHVFAALAPTSQPSRGKCPNCSGPASPDTHNLHVCSTCNGKGYIGQPLVDLADCPDCAQPSRAKLACRLFGHTSTDHGPFHGAWPDDPCRRCGGHQRVTVQRGSGPSAEFSDEDCPGCADCAQPERQGAGHYRYSGIDGLAQIAVEVMARNDSNPPTDDIVAGLYAVRAYPGLHAQGLDHLREKIDRAIAALGEKGWQPIETAPKDGRIVIGWSAGWESPTAIQWVDAVSYQGEYGPVNESADWDWNGTILCPPSHDPTHWRPMPAPPIADSQ